MDLLFKIVTWILAIGVIGSVILAIRGFFNNKEEKKYEGIGKAEEKEEPKGKKQLVTGIVFVVIMLALLVLVWLEIPQNIIESELR